MTQKLIDLAAEIEALERDVEWHQNQLSLVPRSDAEKQLVAEVELEIKRLGLLSKRMEHCTERTKLIKSEIGEIEQQLENRREECKSLRKDQDSYRQAFGEHQERMKVLGQKIKELEN